MSAISDSPMKVGFVCEGSTDVLVLREIAESMLGPLTARTLQPQTDQLDRQLPGAAGGWSEVRTWCERTADLADLFEPDLGEGLDLLVIGLDLDIAIKAGVRKRPENLSGYDATALVRLVRSWLPKGSKGHKRRVLVAVPVMAVESWIIAAVLPKRHSPELLTRPATELMNAGKIPANRNGEPWKRVKEYLLLSKAVARELQRVTRRCPSAKAYVDSLAAHANAARG